MRQILHHPHLVNATDKHVLSVMAFHADTNAECWPGVDTLVVETSLSKRAVRDVLTRLEAARYFTVLERGAGKGHKSRYRLHPLQGGVVTVATPDTGQAGPGSGPRKGAVRKGAGGAPFAGPKGAAHSLNDVPPKGAAHAKGAAHSLNDVPPVQKDEVPELNGEEVPKEVLAPPLPARTHGTPAREAAPAGTPPPPPPPRKLEAVDIFTTDVAAALCAVCGLMPDQLSWRDREQLPAVRQWVLDQWVQEQSTLDSSQGEMMSSDESAVATALRERFANWDKPTPPRLSQIGKEWRRMELIAAFARQRGKDAASGTVAGGRAGGAGGVKEGRDSVIDRAYRRS